MTLAFENIVTCSQEQFALEVLVTQEEEEQTLAGEQEKEDAFCMI